MICPDCQKRVPALYRCAVCEKGICRTCAQYSHVCPELKKP